ncbi:MAG: aldehyde dehydrogenase family protein [Halobacteriovoraceae bacterium]|jgi:acyl-CoA reductase-like NAD-dependent aldehyde dehydrogenase|nr:aldehyde dehydrogenase family protein [Halobacteriovoraceae bacterium]
MSHLICNNPFTGDEVAQFELSSLEAATEKINDLCNSQKSWHQESLEMRIELVSTALTYFKTQQEQIALDICEQMGRPLHQCSGEINGMLERANYLCSIASKTLADDVFTDQAGFKRSIQHVPLGVIFVISAWNYPLLITINSIIPALLAGNSVLLKHSSITPKIGEHFERAFSELGQYKDLLKHVIISHHVTGQIIETQKIDHVIFTGSVNGGKQILSHTAKRFMMPGLELGGKDATYVHHDAKLDYAVESIVDGAMFNSGQSCCGIERAYVHEDIYDEFLEKALKLISTYNLGDPKNPATSLGPLATNKAAEFMLNQVADAKNHGAHVLAGGKIQSINKGMFFEATLIANTNHDMQVMREENFGPILPVMKVKDLDEAINFVNDSEYGLTSSVFTTNEKTATLFAQQAESGTVFMNRCDYLDPALPWTGIKNSGCGSSLSKYGFFHVTRRKSINFKLTL